MGRASTKGSAQRMSSSYVRAPSRMAHSHSASGRRTSTTPSTRISRPSSAGGTSASRAWCRSRGALRALLVRGCARRATVRTAATPSVSRGNHVRRRYAESANANPPSSRPSPPAAVSPPAASSASGNGAGCAAVGPSRSGRSARRRCASRTARDCRVADGRQSSHARRAVDDEQQLMMLGLPARARRANLLSAYTTLSPLASSCCSKDDRPIRYLGGGMHTPRVSVSLSAVARPCERLPARTRRMRFVSQKRSFTSRVPGTHERRSRLGQAPMSARRGACSART